MAQSRLRRDGSERRPLDPERQALVERHLCDAERHARSAARRFPRCEPDEFLSECRLRLCVAAADYDGRIPFGPYLNLHLKDAVNRVLMGRLPVGYRRRSARAGRTIGARRDRGRRPV